MLGSPVAEERKRRWRSESWRNKGGEDVSFCGDDRRGGGGGRSDDYKRS